MAKAKKSSDVVLSRRSAKELAQTRVILRRLPPATTEEEIRERLKDAPDHEFLYFNTSDRSLEPFAFCRAYINLRKPEEAVKLRELIDGQLWKDSTGRECPVVVEFAPYQKVLRRTRKKPDSKMGTLEDDPDYVTFLKTLETEAEPPPPLDSLAAEEDEAKQKEEEELQKRTPLIEFIRQRHSSRQAPSRTAIAVAGKPVRATDKHPVAGSKGAPRTSGSRPVTSAKEKKADVVSGKASKESLSSRSHGKEDQSEHRRPYSSKSAGHNSGSGSASSSASSAKTATSHHSDSFSSSSSSSSASSSHKEKDKASAHAPHGSESRKSRGSGSASAARSQELSSSQGKSPAAPKAAAGPGEGSRKPGKKQPAQAGAPGAWRGSQSTKSADTTVAAKQERGDDVEDSKLHGRGGTGQAASRGSRAKDVSGRKGSRTDPPSSDSHDGGRADRQDSRRSEKLPKTREPRTGSRPGPGPSASDAADKSSRSIDDSPLKVLVRDGGIGEASGQAAAGGASSDGAKDRKKRPSQQIYQPRSRQERTSGSQQKPPRQDSGAEPRSRSARSDRSGGGSGAAGRSEGKSQGDSGSGSGRGDSKGNS